MASEQGVDHDFIDSKITRNFLSFHKGDTAGAVKITLRQKAKQFASIGYIYIVDESTILEGIVSLKQILQASDESTLESMMSKDVISVRFHSRPERVVYLALKHGLKSIPVVDDERRLIGIVTHGTILSVFHHELREDILRAGGVHHTKGIESIETPVKKLVRARFPSLFLGLLGGLVTASIVTGFDELLREYIALAAFIPAIVYLTDAVGTQSQTLVVRLIAMDPKFSFRRYLLRETRVGLVLGSSFAALLFIAGVLGWGSTNLAAVIGTSILISMVFQTFFATYISMLLERMRVDPATASGPIATIISDITTIAIYFGIGTILLQIL